MTTGKMHADEVETDVYLVSRLLASQFPQWADLAIEPVQSSGTDNALYRVGEELVVRLPRVQGALSQIEKERDWLPRLAPHLPLHIPVQLAIGKPGEGYPCHWSIYQWLPGVDATKERLCNPKQAAIDLARFLAALQEINPAGGPPPGLRDLARGQPLARRDPDTRKAIAVLDGMVDAEAVTAIWEGSLQAPEWEPSPVWIHGDMLPGNLLFEQDRLSAVIDFGTLGVGDPACDLMIAWNLFTGESRDTFRKAMAVDDATWLRGRGWALSQALIFIPYYWNKNPVGVAFARRAIEEAVAEYRTHG